MTPISIRSIAKQHWKDKYPEAYRLMKLHNALESEAQAAAELTLQEMELQEITGMTTLEAWQASRELWVFKDPMLDWQPPETTETPQ